MNGRFLILVLDTVNRLYRNRVIVFVAIATILFISMTSLYIGSSKIANAAYYGVLNSWITFLCLFIAPNLILDDIENKTLEQILALPISRYKYIYSRICGGLVIIMLYYIISIIIINTVHYVNSKTLLTNSGIFLGFIINTFRASLILTMGTLLSLFLSRRWATITSVLIYAYMSFAYYSVGSIGIEEILNQWSNYSIFNMINTVICLFLYYLTPHLNILSDISNAMMGSGKLNNLNYLKEFSHIIFTGLLWNIIFVYIFKKRDI